MSKLTSKKDISSFVKKGEQVPTSSLKEGVSQTKHVAKAMIAQSRKWMNDGCSQTKDVCETYVKEHPLKSMAIVLSVGALLASACWGVNSRKISD